LQCYRVKVTLGIDIRVNVCFRKVTRLQMTSGILLVAGRTSGKK
jgi:hypothetical protein